METLSMKCQILFSGLANYIYDIIIAVDISLIH